MENAKFLRSVIRLQQKFGDQFSEFMQKLYTNEYDDEISEKVEDKSQTKDKSKNNNSTDENTDGKVTKAEINDTDNINISNIIVRFPSPASLASTNLQEQINSTQTIIDYITEITVGSEDEKKARSFKSSLAREMLTNIPWNMVDEILERIELIKSKDSITKGKEEDTEY